MHSASMDVWLVRAKEVLVTSVLTLVSNTSDGVCAIDVDQHIVLWNAAAKSLLGYKADEALGCSCFDIFGGRSESGARICRPSCGHLASALNQKPLCAFDMHARHKSGARLWLNMSTIVVPSRWSELSVLIHLFRDINKRKQDDLLAHRILAAVSRLMVSEQHKRKSGTAETIDAVGLTPRECEVLRLLGAGTSTVKIAEILAVRPTTVRAHVRHILSKLGVHSRLEAVTLAIRRGLV